ncbi:MAG TPA: succinate dehydrogenase, cytochrome b556 subunit [Bacteroidota bacterium]|nr:succinate dehydrogenase, cytochrome b556 subunit [Bacteroidota bacterium]
MSSNYPSRGWAKVLLTYHKFSGSWAWVLHRITGLVLTAYIMVHIFALMSLQKGKAAFDSEMVLFRTPLFLFLEWLLFAFVLFHALNGIRIVLVDLAEGARYHKKLYYAVVIIGLILFFGMGYIMFTQDTAHAVASVR